MAIIFQPYISESKGTWYILPLKTMSCGVTPYPDFKSAKFRENFNYCKYPIQGHTSINSHINSAGIEEFRMYFQATQKQETPHIQEILTHFNNTSKLTRFVEVPHTVPEHRCMLLVHCYMCSTLFSFYIRLQAM